MSFFSYPSFSVVIKHDFISKKNCFWNLSFCDPQIVGIEYRKAQLVLILPEVSTHFSQKKQVPILSFGNQLEDFQVYMSNSLRNFWFCTLHHKFGSPKNLKSAMIFDLTRFSNMLFIATTVLNFFHQKLNRKFHPCKQGFDLLFI